MARRRRDNQDDWAVVTPGTAEPDPPQQPDGEQEPETSGDHDAPPAEPKPKRALFGGLGISRKSKPAGEPAADSSSPGHGPKPKPAEPKPSPMPIPKVGSEWRGDRRTKAHAKMVVLLVAGCVIAGVGVAVGALAAASGREKPLPPGLTARNVADYHLSTFPVSQAAALAERYVKTCFTFDSNDPDAMQVRTAALASMAASDVDPQCGWDGSGKQTVTFAAFNGAVAPADDLPDGSGAYIGVTVDVGLGSAIQASVPIYSTGAGVVVDGAVAVDGPAGQLPEQSTVPLEDPGDSDSHLAQSLTTDLLTGFFTAWSASDHVSLARFVTTDASTTATGGLAGMLTDPQLSAVNAYPSRSKPPYQSGDTAQVTVTVVWTVPGSEVTPETSQFGDDGPAAATLTQQYRVSVQLNDQGWFVKDIRGGVGQGGTFGGPASPPVTPTPTTTEGESAAPTTTTGG